VLRTASPCLFIVLAACGINPGFDGPTTTTADADTGPVSSTTTAPIDPSTSTSLATGGDATVVWTDTDPTTDPAVDPTTTTQDPTTTGSEGTTSDDTTTGLTGVEELQPFNPDNCDQPLWCFANGDINNGIPTRIATQACFTPATPRPYHLTAIHYHVAASSGDMQDAKIEVHAHDFNGVGPLLAEVPLGTTDILAGERDYTFESPIPIDVDTFCVGIIAGRSDPPARFGLAVDPGYLPDDQSYVRIDGQACNMPNWTDIHDFDPTPKGGWCIAADVTP